MWQFQTPREGTCCLASVALEFPIGCRRRLVRHSRIFVATLTQQRERSAQAFYLEVVHGMKFDARVQKCVHERTPEPPDLRIGDVIGKTRGLRNRAGKFENLHSSRSRATTRPIPVHCSSVRLTLPYPISAPQAYWKHRYAQKLLGLFSFCRSPLSSNGRAADQPGMKGQAK